MQTYDPDQAPDPQEWLALDAEERRRLVERYYAGEGDYGGSLDVHAKVHATIETQLAEGVAPVKAAFMRLRDNGLSRVDAIRAIGSVLARRIRRIENPADLASAPNREYFSALEILTADTWHREQGRENRP
jgi:hypothetical protein